MRARSDTSGNPFGPDAPAEALYVGTVLQQRLDLIEHLLEFGRQLILLSGGPGAGKSTALALMAAAAGERWRAIPLHGGPTLDGAGLLTEVADALDCASPEDDEDPDGQQRRLETVRQRIGALEKSGKPVVLLLDDADQLPSDALSTLLALARTEDQSAEARVLMTAATEHSGLIAALQRDRQQHGLVHVVEIPGIADDETADFLKQRLGGALGTLDDWFTPDTLARFAEEANGNPATLLALAREVSGDARPASSHGDSSRLSRLQTLLGAGEHQSPLRRWAPLALVPLGLLVWFALKPATPQVPELLPEQTPPTVSTMESASTTTDSPLAASSSSSGSQRIEITLPPTPSAPAESSDSDVVNEPAAAAALAPPIAVPDAPPPSAPALADNGLAAGATAAAVASAIPAAPTVTEVPAPPPTATPIHTNPDKKPTVATSKSPAKPTKPVAKPVKPKATVKPTAKVAPATPALVKPGTGYALQFFGVTERKAATNFIARHNLGDRARIIDSKRAGQPWFVVVYGAYPTRAAAQNAVGRLPPAVRREVQPWVRDVKSLNALPR